MDTQTWRHKGEILEDIQTNELEKVLSNCAGIPFQEVVVPNPLHATSQEIFLPAEILVQIFKHLSSNSNDLVRVGMVNKFWKCCSEMIGFWKKCRFSIAEGKLNKFLDFLAKKSDAIEVLEIKYHNSFMNLMEKSLPSSNSNHSSVPTTSEENLKFTSILVSMKKLVCFRTFIYFELSYLPDTLKHLYLVANYPVREKDLKLLIKTSPYLENLTIHDYKEGQEESFGFLYLQRKRSLKHFSITCQRVCLRALIQISNIDKLVCLNLWKFNSPCVFPLTFLCKLPNLRVLSLELMNGMSVEVMKSFRIPLFTVETFIITLNNEALNHSFYDGLRLVMPKLKILAIDNCYLLAAPLKFYLRTFIFLEKLILRSVDICKTKVLDILSNTRSEGTPPLEIKVCNSNLELKDCHLPYFMLYCLSRDSHSDCNVCSDYFSNFVCECDSKH